MGGGSSSTTSVDPEYNARMATIAEQQQEMFDQMYSFYRFGTFDGAPQNIEGISQKSKDAVTLEGIAKDPYQGQQNEFGIDYSNADYSFLDDLGYKPPTYYANPANPQQTTTDKEKAQQWVNDYNAQHGTEIWTTQDGREFSSYEDAVEYSYQQGFAERPASYASMEQQAIESNMQLQPAQTELQLAQLETELGLTGQRGATEGAQLNLAQQQAEAQAGLLPQQTELQSAQLGLGLEQTQAASGLLPYQTDAARHGFIYDTEAAKAATGLLPYQTEAAKSGFLHDKAAGETGVMREGERQRVLGYGSQITPEYFKSAMQSYNPEQYASRYASDVIQEYSNQQELENIRMGALGALPGSTRSVAQQTANTADRALAVSSAKTMGRDYAKDKRHSNLQGAMGILGGV
jgi:hypothetical protein